MAGLAVFPVMYVLSRSVTYLYLMQAASGFCLGGLNLAVFNLVLEYSKPGRSASAVAVFNMLMNVATFAAPFLGDVFYNAFGIPTVFYAGTCVRLVSLLLLSAIIERPHLAFPRVARLRRRCAGITKGGDDGEVGGGYCQR